MRNRFRTLSFLIKLVLFFTAAQIFCGCVSSLAKDNQILKNHSLVYSKAKTEKIFSILDLETKKEEIFFQSRHYESGFRGISKIKPSWVIFGECPSYDYDCQLKIFNFNSGSWEVWGKGFLPKYLEESKTLAYYIENDQTKVKEFIVSSNEKPREVVFKTKSKIPEEDAFFFNLDPTILNIEGKGILFLGNDEELKFLKLKSMVVSGSGIRRCSPKFWRTKSQKLYCRNWDDGKIWEIDFNDPETKKIMTIPGHKGVIMRILYDEGLDILIFSTINTNFLLNEVEKYRLYSYSFKNKETHKIQDSPLGDGLLLPKTNK